MTCEIGKPSSSVPVMINVIAINIYCVLFIFQDLLICISNNENMLETEPTPSIR